MTRVDGERDAHRTHLRLSAWARRAEAAACATAVAGGSTGGPKADAVRRKEGRASDARTATITAETELRCYGMTSWEFRPLVETHGSIAWKLLQAMSKTYQSPAPH